MERMGNIAIRNLKASMDAFFTMNEREIQEVYETEDQINLLNHAITDYLVKVNQTTIPTDDKKSIGGLFHVVNDIERIGDHAENVADAAKQRMENQVEFSPQAKRELNEMLDMVVKITTSHWICSPITIRSICRKSWIWKTGSTEWKENFRNLISSVLQEMNVRHLQV